MAMISAFTTVDKMAHNSQYADALAAIGEPVKDKDLVMLAVLGFREEYNSLKTTITARQSPTAFSELHALLMGLTSMPEALQAQLLELTAQLSAIGFQVAPIAPPGPQAFYGARPSNNKRNDNNNNHGNRNNSRGNNNNQGRDTRANSHVTPDLEAMENSEAYYGDDTLHAGNGKGLPILHIGSSKVYSPQKTVSIKNILHVPEISHNLFSVQKFYHDNDVFFEFHTSYFVVKDESIHTTLLTGPSKHGFYTITIPQLKSINKVSFSAVRASPTI
ncbi:putative ribonuclease H-like domain-containing protein [Tanacetum coccineum]